VCKQLYVLDKPSTGGLLAFLMLCTNLYCELKSAGFLNEGMFVYKVTKVLKSNAQYSTWVDIVRARGPLPKFNDLSDEAQEFFAAEITQEQTAVSPIEGAFHTNSSHTPPETCSYCGYKYHSKTNCCFYQRDKEQGLLKPPGWYKANHKKRKGQRSKHQVRQVPQGQFPGALITPAAFQSTTTASNGFIIDSGATHHMVNKVSLLRNTHAVDVKVLTANQQAVTCTLKGEAIVKTDTGKEVLLKEVLLLPALTCNLLSVRKANEAGLKVEFTRNGNVTGMAQDPRRLLMSGRASGSPYELVGHALTLSMVAAAAQNPPISAPSNLIATRFLNTLEALWHSRLGHLNYTSLAKRAANRRAKRLPTSGGF
jgi:hypothetical protein